MKRLIPILLLAACSTTSTHVTDVYRDPDAKPVAFQRLAAIAIVDNPAVRRQAEDEMVRQIGTRAVASYTILTAEDERSATAVRAKLQSLGIDGAVTMEMLSLGEEPIDPRGEIPDSYKAFSGAYGSGRSGADAWEEVARIQTQIFSVTDDRLLWSAATKTFEPSNAAEIVAAVSRAVVKELRDADLMP